MHYVAFVVNQYSDNTEKLCENTFTISVTGILLELSTRMKSALKFMKNFSSASNAATRNVAGDGYADGGSATIPELPVFEDLTFIEVETNGFDPYNSGSFDSLKFSLKK